MLRGMSEASGPGNKAQQLKAQATQKAREVRVQALAKAPQLTGAVAQQAQRVVQDKPGVAAGAAPAGVGVVGFRRRPRPRGGGKKGPPGRGGAQGGGGWRGAA